MSLEQAKLLEILNKKNASQIYIFVRSVQHCSAYLQLRDTGPCSFKLETKRLKFVFLPLEAI